MAVLTIEELLARKEQQAQKGKPVSKSVFIPGLGGEVEVVPMDPSKFLEYSFQLGNSNGDGAAMLDAPAVLSSMTGSCKMPTGAKNPTR